jgi:hypothetical protein
MGLCNGLCETGYTEKFEAGKGIKLPGSQTQEEGRKNILSRFKFWKIRKEFMNFVSELSFHVTTVYNLYTVVHMPSRKKV